MNMDEKFLYNLVLRQLRNEEGDPGFYEDEELDEDMEDT